MGGFDPETDLFKPLQKLLDQCKGAKALSRWAGFIETNKLKSHLLPQLKALNNLVPELVNFGISVRVSK
jgi:dynactin 1